MLSSSSPHALWNRSSTRMACLTLISLRLSVLCSWNSLRVRQAFAWILLFLTSSLFFAYTVCLWGNSTDLSLLINMTEEQIKSLQSTGGENLAATEKNILGNHMSRLWEVVRDMRDKTGGRVDFVLDNAGFELYCDCVYGASSFLSAPIP